MKKIMVVSHERSGTHFLLNSLAYNFSSYHKRVLSLEFDNPKPLLDCIKESGEVLFKSHHHVSFFEPVWEELTKECHIICIVREGKDVLTSSFNHYCKFYPDTKYDGNFANFIKGQNAPEKLLQLYNNNQPYDNMPDKWQRHVQGWLEKSGQVFCIKYEDLLHDFEKTLLDVSEFIEHDLPKVTRKPSLASDNVQPRAGKAGDWVNFFSQEALDIFNHVAGAFNEKIGYENTEKAPDKEFIPYLNISSTTDISRGYLQLSWMDKDEQQHHALHHISQPLPFEDTSLQLIQAWDVMGFIGDEFEDFLADLHRCMIQGGMLSIKVAEYPCAMAISHPATKRVFTPFTFNYYEHFFDVMHTEVIEKARGGDDRGMLGSYESQLYIELRKKDPIQDFLFKKQRDEMTDEQGNLSLKTAHIQ